MFLSSGVIFCVNRFNSPGVCVWMDVLPSENHSLFLNIMTSKSPEHA